MRRFTPLCLYVDEGYPIAEMLEGTGEYRHESDVIALEQENERLRKALLNISNGIPAKALYAKRVLENEEVLKALKVKP